MTREHPAEHEELLAEVLTGERSERDAEVRARLEDCAACRQELEEMRAAMALLDDAGDQERRTFAEAESIGSAPGVEKVEPVVAELFADDGGAPAPGRRPGRLLWFAAAAAVAAALLLFVLGPRTERGGEGAGAPDVVLGPENTLRCVAPVGPVDHYDVFRWEGELEAGQWFVVEVFAEDGVLPDAVSPSFEDEDERAWTPTPTRIAALPAHIRWRVSVMDDRGFVASAEAEAQRR